MAIFGACPLDSSVKPERFSIYACGLAGQLVRVLEAHLEVRGLKYLSDYFEAEFHLRL